KMGNGGTFAIPLYRYTKEGQRIDNITDWALQQFTEHYYGAPPSDAFEASDGYSNNKANITKQDIFHYVYAVLHHPAYRKQYELNLKREFPRIPFYDNFPQWVKWGEQLMNLHINY